jgi:hypothetical protein
VCSSHVWKYVDGNNAAITKNSPRLCEDCYKQKHPNDHFAIKCSAQQHEIDATHRAVSSLIRKEITADDANFTDSDDCFPAKVDAAPFEATTDTQQKQVDRRKTMVVDCVCTVHAAKKYRNVEWFVCATCGKTLCKKHTHGYLDENNMLISKTAKPLCSDCFPAKVDAAPQAITTAEEEWGILLEDVLRASIVKFVEQEVLGNQPIKRDERRTPPLELLQEKQPKPKRKYHVPKKVDATIPLFDLQKPTAAELRKLNQPIRLNLKPAPLFRKETS